MEKGASTRRKITGHSGSDTTGPSDISALEAAFAGIKRELSDDDDITHKLRFKQQDWFELVRHSSGEGHDSGVVVVNDNARLATSYYPGNTRPAPWWRFSLSLLSSPSSPTAQDPSAQHDEADLIVFISG